MKFTYHNRLNRYIICVLLICLSLSALAQKTQIKQRKADLMNGFKNSRGEQVIRYTGNVEFDIDGTRLFADSADLNKVNNTLEARGDVIIQQEKTRLYGDFLFFDGKKSTGRLYGREVKMVDDKNVLITDLLNFNSKNKSAFYTTGGRITNEDNTLESIRGYYFSQKKKFYFAGNVDMNGKDGHIRTDSLEYSSDQELAYFYGPTRIANDDNFVYCEKGWYNRQLEQSNFTQNAYIINGSQMFYGQNIYYDKKNGYARAIGEVAVVDTVQKITIYGGKANIWDKKKEAEVTENPLLVMQSDGDSLFLRSDLMIIQNIPDSTLPDSSYRLMKAIGDVKFFRGDIQGISDSMYYNSKDSTMSMFSSPILWNENNQITATFIKAYTKKNKINRMDFDGSALISSQEESDKFNQVKGKNMIAHFTNGRLSKLDVKGNGQTVYYIRDEGELSAVNKAESSDLTVFIHDNKISKILFLKKPIATLYPVDKVEPEEVTLKGFKWLADKRPASRETIIPKGLKFIQTDKSSQK